MRDPHVRFCERHGGVISRAYSTVADAGLEVGHKPRSGLTCRRRFVLSGAPGRDEIRRSAKCAGLATSGAVHIRLLEMWFAE